jgi:hypothetical protein
MQVAVSFDKSGNITVMFDPSKLKGEKCTIGYEPAPGENHHVLDLPKQLEGKPFTELAAALRVNTSGAAPKLEAKA